MTRLNAADLAEFKSLDAAERAAWRRLNDDPQPLADPTAPHTPEIEAAWKAAADAVRDFRMARDLVGMHISTRDGWISARE